MRAYLVDVVGDCGEDFDTPHRWLDVEPELLQRQVTLATHERRMQAGGGGVEVLLQLATHERIMQAGGAGIEVLLQLSEFTI